jgi:hypothetical protein
MRKNVEHIFNIHHTSVAAHHGVHHRHGRSALVMVVFMQGDLRE